MACRSKGVQLENVHLRLKHSNLDIVINHQCQWITKKVCTCHTSNVMMASTTSVVHDQTPRVEVISMNKQSFSNPHIWFWSHKRRFPTSHPHNGLTECLLLWLFGRRLTVNIGQHCTNFYHMLLQSYCRNRWENNCPALCTYFSGMTQHIISSSWGLQYHNGIQNEMHEMATNAKKQRL